MARHSSSKKVTGVRGAGRGRKTWYECVKKELGLHAEWAVFREGVKEGVHFGRERLTLAELGKMDVLEINDDDDDRQIREFDQ